MAFNDQDLFNRMLQASTKQEGKEGLFNAVNDMPDELPPRQEVNSQQLSPWAQYLETNINPHLRSLNEAIEQKFVRPIRESPIGAAQLGLMQGLHNIAASGINAVLPEQYQAQPINTYGLTDPNNAFWHGAGDIGGSMLGEAALYSSMPFAKGAEGLKRVVVEALKGAGAGYLGGQFMPGGRETSAAIGAAVPFITQSMSPVLARMIGKDAEALSKSFGKEYEAFKKQYGEIPANLSYSEAIDELIKGKRLTKDASKPLNEFLKQPKAKNAHEALSALKAEQRGMLTKTNPTVKSLPREDKATYELIGDAIDSIEKQMQKGFEKSGKPEAFKIYKDLAERFKTEYAPYKFSELEAFLSQSPLGGRRGSSKGVTKAIQGMADYPADIHKFFMEKYPELYLNKYLPQLGGAGLVAGATQTDFGKQLLQQLLGKGEQE